MQQTNYDYLYILQTEMCYELSTMEKKYKLYKMCIEVKYFNYIHDFKQCHKD